LALVEYLPEFMREIKAIDKITRAEEGEFALAAAAVGKRLDDQFAAFADGDGLTRWERLFGITPKGTRSIEERRSDVLERLSERPPYTLASLDRALFALCAVNGKREYSLSADCAGYTVTARLNPAVHGAAPAAARLLRRRVPANMAADLVLVYNAFGSFGGYSYGELGSHTHETLRRGIFQ
jgi:hypothetical protein